METLKCYDDSRTLAALCLTLKLISTMTRPLNNLLNKNAPFVIDESCVKAFEKLRSLLVLAPIVQPLDFSYPFKIMCRCI